MKADGFLRATLENISRGMYDDFVESSCRSMRKSGAKAVIVRKEIGSCCDWCRSLAGTYDYSAGQYPDDIFRRHENCRCIVTVSNEKGHYTDVWSKREYDSERELIRGRIEDIQHEEARTAVRERKARKRAKAVSEGKQFFDSTDFWKDADRRAGEDFYTGVKDPGKVFYKDGQRYEIDNHHVKFEPSQHEREIAEVLAEQLHERVILQPKIEYPKGIKMPDYTIGGKSYDLKTIEGAGKNTLDSSVKRKKGQASNFVFDVTKFAVSDDEMFRQASHIIERRDWIDKVILIRNNEIIRIFERT